MGPYADKPVGLATTHAPGLAPNRMPDQPPASHLPGRLHGAEPASLQASTLATSRRARQHLHTSKPPGQALTIDGAKPASWQASTPAAFRHPHQLPSSLHTSSLVGAMPASSAALEEVVRRHTSRDCRRMHTSRPTRCEPGIYPGARSEERQALQMQPATKPGCLPGQMLHQGP